MQATLAKLGSKIISKRVSFPNPDFRIPVRSHNSKSRKMIRLSVDGNISSGKSTLVSALVDLVPKNKLGRMNGRGGATTGDYGLKVEVIPEPLDKWCDLQGYNLLEMFYKDSKKYNFLFEHYVQLTRLMDAMKKPDWGIRDDEGDLIEPMEPTLLLRIMERSLQNNRFCFMELAKKSGNLHPAEFSVLSEWYKWLENRLDLNLDLIIYLRTEPSIAYERMKMRARAAEDLCPLDYLAELHESYEEWLVRNPKTNSHVIILDANRTKEEVSAECFLKLKEYLENLRKKTEASECIQDDSAHSAQ